MRRGESEAGGEGTGMSPRSARAAGAGRREPCAAPRSGDRAGCPGQAAREGTPGAGRKGTPGKPRSLTHSLIATGEQPPRPPSPPLRAARSHQRWARHRPQGHRDEGVTPGPPRTPAKVTPSPGVPGRRGGKFSI